MPRAYTLTLQRPHEAFSFRMPVGRRLHLSTRNVWLGFMLCATFACGVLYIIGVNAAATKGFTLRALQNQHDHLQTSVSALENAIASSQSLHNVAESVQGQGYVEPAQIEYIENPVSGVAMAR